MWLITATYWIKLVKGFFTLSSKLEHYPETNSIKKIHLVYEHFFGYFSFCPFADMILTCHFNATVTDIYIIISHYYILQVACHSCNL